MELEAGRTGFDDLLEGSRASIIPLAGKREIHRQAIRRCQHLSHVERARRAGRRVGPGTGPRASPNHRRDTRSQGFGHLLRTNVVDVCVDRTRGD